MERHASRRRPALRGARSTSTCATLRLQGWDACRCRELLGRPLALPARRRLRARRDPAREGLRRHRGRGDGHHRRRRGDARAATTRATSAPDEARAIENRTNRPASMLVVMPYPPGTMSSRRPSAQSLFDLSARVRPDHRRHRRARAARRRERSPQAGARLTLAGGGRGRARGARRRAPRSAGAESRLVARRPATAEDAPTRWSSARSRRTAGSTLSSPRPA